MAVRACFSVVVDLSRSILTPVLMQNLLLPFWCGHLHVGLICKLWWWEGAELCPCDMATLYAYRKGDEIGSGLILF